MQNRKVSFSYLIITFLKVGAASFGGYASLVAVVQRIMADEDKTIGEETIVEGFALASILPGPVAVNTVTYIGYKLRSWPGGLLVMGAVVFPSFVIMLVLAIMYQEWAGLQVFDRFLQGVLPVVMAIIVSMLVAMYPKQITNNKQWLIILLVAIIQYMLRGYLAFVLSFITGGLLGYWLFRPAKRKTRDFSTGTSPIRFSAVQFGILVLLLVALLLNFLSLPQSSSYLQLGSTFAGISLTLFGGGYVMIPVLSQLVVEQQGWLTSTEFSDAIALGQVTPGPILISAAFIGYQVEGITGAALATISIFLPSGLLIMLVADFCRGIENHPVWKAVWLGIKPVVLTLMASSLFVLGQTISDWWFAIVVLLLAFALILKFRFNFLWLLLLAGVAGVLYL